MEIELNENFKEFIELLNEKKVKYLVVGGFAVGLHGYPNDLKIKKTAIGRDEKIGTD